MEHTRKYSLGINALIARVEKVEAELAAARAENAELKARVEELEKGEWCEYAYLDDEDGPNAENRCRAPQVPGAQVCINADKGYGGDCRMPSRLEADLARMTTVVETAIANAEQESAAIWQGYRDAATKIRAAVEKAEAEEEKP
jgi:hypothetical protein